MNDELSVLALAAQGGSKEALDSLVRAVQRPVYNLALRMLQRPADAEDAAQEILIKLVTHLGQFRGESAFSTWMYRVASNHLLTQRRRNADARRISFEGLAERLAEGLASQEDGPDEVYEQAELLEETRRSCTLGMLQCLDPDERLAVILADILEVGGAEGAAILEVSPAAFRKRLSRARQSLVAFVAGHCGIVNPDSPCRCHKLARARREVGLIGPDRLQYDQPLGDAGARDLARAQQADLSADERALALLRAHPTYIARADLAARIERIVAAGRPGTQHPPAA
jgi:RNA polymerase sigma factor (sigma-70 family)